MAARAWQHIPWMRWFLLFWRIVLWVSLLIGLNDVWRADPAIFMRWRGAVMLALLAVFLVVYELYERTDARRGLNWPAPYRLVLAYLIVQIPCTLALAQFSFGFIGPIFALMGQVFSSLPMRRWLVPIGALVITVSVPLGLIDTLRSGDWAAMAGFAFFMANWVGLAVFVAILFNERDRHEHLISELRMAKEASERYAMQAEELAALRERARLARDMHDNLGHALVAVNVQLEAAQRLYAVDKARGDAQLEGTRAVVRETMAELRRSLANLRADLPSHQQLIPALQSIAEEVRARGILDVHCNAPPDLPPLPTAASEALWRVAREALSNVERHAAAASASVTIERMDGAVVLRVADDGSGMSAGALARPGHYGIAGMRERMEAVGGSLRIGNRSGGGTLVEARIPVA